MQQLRNCSICFSVKPPCGIPNEFFSVIEDSLNWKKTNEYNETCKRILGFFHSGYYLLQHPPVYKWLCWHISLIFSSDTNIPRDQHLTFSDLDRTRVDRKTDPTKSPKHRTINLIPLHFLDFPTNLRINISYRNDSVSL